MFVDFLIGYIGPLIVFAIECREVVDIWRRSPISLSIGLYDVFSLILTEPHTNQTTFLSHITNAFETVVTNALTQDIMRSLDFVKLIETH